MRKTKKACLVTLPTLNPYNWHRFFFFFFNSKDTLLTFETSVMLDIRHLHDQIGTRNGSSRSTPRIHLNLEKLPYEQTTHNALSSGKTKSSLQRPLGKPVSDLSMYYDKNFFFPPAEGQKRGGLIGGRGRGAVGDGKKGRPATTIPCITRKCNEDTGINRR